MSKTQKPATSIKAGTKARSRKLLPKPGAKPDKTRAKTKAGGSGRAAREASAVGAVEPARVKRVKPKRPADTAPSETAPT